MKKDIQTFWAVCGIIIAFVAAVMLVSYCSLFVAITAVLRTVSECVVAFAVLGIVCGWAVCWVVPILTVPLIVGITMDFYIGCLDKNPCQHRVKTGSGLMLLALFFGLLFVPIRSVRQIATCVVVAVTFELLIMRTLVMPAALILAKRKSAILRASTEMLPPLQDGNSPD